MSLSPPSRSDTRNVIELVLSEAAYRRLRELAQTTGNPTRPEFVCRPLKGYDQLVGGAKKGGELIRQKGDEVTRIHLLLPMRKLNGRVLGQVYYFAPLGKIT